MIARILLVALILFPLSTIATAATKVEIAAQAQSTYNSVTTYDGLYKNDRIYVLHQKNQIWFADTRFKEVAAIACFEARSTLGSKGIWIGNLFDDGNCAGIAEAPTWAIGNYLNFVIIKKSAEDALTQ